MKNPFVFGKVVNKKNFCNRKEEIKQLKEYINNTFSVWLFAPRRYGKTSLIKHVFKETKKIKTIYFDLYNIQSLDDFCRKYSNTLAKELFNWKDDIKNLSIQAGKYFKSLSPQINFDENGTPSLSLIHQEINKQIDIETILNLPEKIAEKKNIKICIAFDEFQEIERIDKFIINWMRSSFQYHENVSYVFLGSKQSLMQTIFSSTNSPFYEYAVKMDIKPIPRAELKRFLKQKYREQNIEINTLVLNSILNISGCHPHFTQYFAAVVYDEIKAGYNQNDENFNAVWIEKIIDSQSFIFQNIYDQLNNNQRKILIALSQNITELFSDKIRKKYSLPVSSSLSSSLKSLITKNIINKNVNVYKISNPVFKLWINKITSNSKLPSGL